MTASRARGLTGALTIVLLAHASLVRYVEDDAFISYRYAGHLAQGFGLVYNIGERVEGYSNFLWVIALAVASRVLPFLTLPVIGAAGTLLAAVAAVVLVARTRLDEHWPATGLVAGLLLAAHAGFVAWSTAGLETVPFAALLTAATLAFARALERGRDFRAAAILFACVALLRADGALFAASSVIAGVWTAWRRGWSRAALLRLLAFAGIVTAVYVPYVAWRYAYYGDLVPNTAYAKVGGDVEAMRRGLSYVWSYIRDYSVWVWTPVVLLHLPRARAWTWYVVWTIGVALGYVVWVGGDSLGFHRFLVHVAPLMSLVLAAAVVDLHRRLTVARGGPFATMGAALGLLLVAALSARPTLEPRLWPDRVRWHEPQSSLSFPGDGTTHDYVWFNNYFVDRLATAARYLQATSPQGSVIAATPAGAVAFGLDRPVIDMLGLTDRHIARTAGRYRDEIWTSGRAGHEKGDGAYVLARRPDYILLGNVAVLPMPLDETSMADKLVFKSEHEIWADPQFHADYERVTVQLADHGPFRFFTFYRRKGRP